MFNQTQLNGLNYAKKTDLLTGIYNAATLFTLNQNLSDVDKQKLAIVF